MGIYFFDEYFLFFEKWYFSSRLFNYFPQDGFYTHNYMYTHTICFAYIYIPIKVQQPSTMANVISGMDTMDGLLSQQNEDLTIFLDCNEAEISGLYACVKTKF